MKPAALKVETYYVHSNGKRYLYKGSSGMFPDRPYVFVGEKNDIVAYGKSFVNKLRPDKG